MTVSPLAPAAFPDLPPVAGVSLFTAAAGIKYAGRTDLLLAQLDEGSQLAGVFTRSKTSSAPVDWCRACLAAGDTSVRAILVNSGNANAFTGGKGVASVEATTALAARASNCAQTEVFAASTGVIGEALPVDPFESGLNALDAADWKAAAEAIMTTDTFPKGASVRVGEATIVGITKGSGMIAPDMATMLGFIFTDARIPQPQLQALLRRATDKSFNCMTVDGDTSTSDTVLLSATNRVDVDLTAFERALTELMIDLAQQIARDGEGATKFLTVSVNGAASDDAARRIGLTIANSPLVKTAVAGEDANWGRVVMAVGKSGEEADRDRLSIAMGGVEIAAAGEAVEGYDEAPVAAHMRGQEIDIAVDVGIGSGQAKVWSCDLTHGYITINADYRS